MLVVAVLIAVLLAVYCGFRVERRRRTPPALRGDWWSAFESEFRAYAKRADAARRARERRNDHGSIGQ
ncbi:MAG TPA: hypothetical protein VKR21_04765 [Solirubrobacteraceae bacterium]|nr:hypothetical protein [Solirubrobacteraceae bacterium]